VLIFGFPVPGSDCGRTTTHVPHFGQVTHEHTMRWAIQKLYGQLACFGCLRGRLDGHQHHPQEMVKGTAVSLSPPKLERDWRSKAG
jgi:hypothetical protein